MSQQNFTPVEGSTHLDARNIYNANADDAETRLTALESGGGGGGQVDSVVAGTNVTVDNTDPANPIVNSTATSGTTLSGTTTGTTPTEIFVDGVANNRMTIVGGTTWIFSAYIVATDEDSDGDKAGYKIEGVITNIGGVNSTTSLVGNSVKTVLSEDNPSWDATVVADDTNNALTFVVTGSSTVHWSATVTKTEVGATNILPI